MKRLKKNIREITSSLLGATYMTAIQINLSNGVLKQNAGW